MNEGTNRILWVGVVSNLFTKGHRLAPNLNWSEVPIEMDRLRFWKEKLQAMIYQLTPMVA